MVWHARLLGWSLRGQNQVTARILSTRLLLSILWSVTGPTVLAALTIAGLYMIENYGRSRGIWVPQSWRGVATLRPDTYATLLGTIAQVTGVFLGLYFTAVSAVASAAYARVPSTVRALVVEEKIGNLYVRAVAFEAALATFLLAAHAIGQFFGYLNFALVSVGAIFSIFAFVVLGFRIFYFFDPTKLVGYVEQDFRTAVIAVTPTRRRWVLPPLQMEYHARAQSALSSYRDLVIVATQPGTVESGALLQLTRSLCRSLRFYSNYKNRIPSESWWFAREYRHPDWFSTDYSALSIALETGTSLQPKELPALGWCEKKIEELLDRIIEALSGAADTQALTNVVMLMSEAIKAAAQEMPEDALHTFETLAFTISKGYAGKVATGTALRQDHLHALNLATAQSYLPTAILLGFAQLCVDLNRSSFEAIIETINWKRRQSIYVNFPRSVTQELERLWTEVNAELRIEGKFFIPKWFLLERTNRKLAEFLGTCASRFVSLLDSFFVKAAAASSGENSKLARGPIIQAGLEYCDKLATHLASAQQRFQEIIAAPSIEDIPWSPIDWATLMIRIGTARETLLTMLSDIADDLEGLPVQDYPDYFGQLYSVLAQECYQSLAQSSEERFSKLFPRFFAVAFRGSQRIRQQIGSSEDVKVLLMSDPINDLFDLSGFALIYSELDQKPGYAKAIRTLWDQYFSAIVEPERTQRLQAFASWTNPLLRSTPRDMIRMGWKQNFDRLLQARGIMPDMWSRPHPSQSSRHSSPLIRAIARNPFVIDRAGDVFIVEYLLHRPELDGFRVQDYRTRRLQEGIKEESEGNGDAKK